MKKFISMVMTAAMVASLVPATAFAKSGDVEADVKVVKGWTEHKDSTSLPNVVGSDVPEVQMTITKVNTLQTSKNPETEVTLTLDNAKFIDAAAFRNGITVQDKDGRNVLGDPSGNDTGFAETTEWVEYKEAARKDIIVQALEGKMDANKIHVGTAAPTGAVTTLQSKIDAETTVNKVQTSGKDAFVGAVDKAIEEGKLTTLPGADKDTFNTAASWAYKTNSDGHAVLTDGQNTYLVKDMEAVVGAFSTYKDILTPDYANLKADAVLKTQVNADNLYVPNAKYEPIAGNKHVYIPTDKGIVANGDDELTVKFVGNFKVGDVIAFDMTSKMDKKTSDAKVRVTGDITTSSDYMTYVSVRGKSIKASVKKVVNIAVEEHDEIDSDGVTIEGIVAESFKSGSKVVLRLPSGFNFVDNMKLKLKNFTGGKDVVITGVHIDDNEAEFYIPNNANVIKDDKMVLRGIEVDVDKAKTGAKATLSIKIDNLDKAEVVVAEVVDYKVVMSVDKNKEVPTYYNMTNAEDKGLTSNEEHESMEITLEETFPGAWSMRKGFKITLPEGVFVTDVDVVSAKNFKQSDRNNVDAMRESQEVIWEKAFAKAYQNGNHKNFEFDKRVFDDVNNQLAKDPAKITFTLTLVADYNFEGDVKVGFEGELVDKQEVVAAKFEKPYKVEAGQNDLKIDARQTKLDKNIVVSETADGLWDKKTGFVFNVEKDLIKFEDDAKFTVDKDSGLAINDHSKRNELSFDVKTVGDKKGTVTISDIALFMERNIPQGEYALELRGTLRDALHQQVLFAPDALSPADALVESKVKALKFGDKNLKGDNFVDDVARAKDEVVSKKFINVITARRDEDGFTTRIEVPVGETYIMAGADKLEGAANSMEVPAYINKDGYTMLPLRAVARALGIANGNIYWSQERQTATVQYGNSRIMTFKLGAKEMIINGHSMPAVAGIEMTNNRLFLSLRDLGVAMNVPSEKIAWNKETRKAYLNPTGEDLAAIKD